MRLVLRKRQFFELTGDLAEIHDHFRFIFQTVQRQLESVFGAN